MMITKYHCRERAKHEHDYARNPLMRKVTKRKYFGKQEINGKCLHIQEKFTLFIGYIY